MAEIHAHGSTAGPPHAAALSRFDHGSWAVTTAPGPLEDNESQRLAALQRYGVLDTGGEPAFDALTALAASVCEAPCALLSLVDRDRLWFKSRVGLTHESTPRLHAPCDAAIELPAASGPLLTDPASNPRFAAHPDFGAADGWQFYAGAPLLTPQGWAVGTLCVLDRKPRVLSPQQQQTLLMLAEQAMAQLELRRARALLDLQCNTDEVTSLWNRRSFERRLGEEWARWSRHGGSLALLAVDVDHFKAFNDRHGHRSGDLALQQMALALESALRAHDVLAHFGAGEFGVLLPMTDLSGAMTAAERMRAAIGSVPWAIEALTVSVGVAVAVRERDVEAGALIERTHRALTHAKALGRDRVEPCVD